MKDLKHYLTIVYDESGRYHLPWQAEDADHAIEQARDFLSYRPGGFIEAVVRYTPFYLKLWDDKGQFLSQTAYISFDEAHRGGVWAVNHGEGQYVTYTISRRSYI